MIQVRYKVDKDGCFIVTSRKPTKDGHIKVQVNKKNYYLHRYIFETYVREIPEGILVRHKCDKACCINPAHLTLGTHEDNVRDRVIRNRSAAGENHGRAKLTERAVKDIREDQRSAWKLAKIYGVDPKTIRGVKNQSIWKRVQ